MSTETSHQSRGGLKRHRQLHAAPASRTRNRQGNGPLAFEQWAKCACGCGLIIRAHFRYAKGHAPQTYVPEPTYTETPSRPVVVDQDEADVAELFPTLGAADRDAIGTLCADYLYLVDWAVRRLSGDRIPADEVEHDAVAALFRAAWDWHFGGGGVSFQPWARVVIRRAVLKGAKERKEWMDQERLEKYGYVAYLDAPMGNDDGDSLTLADLLQADFDLLGDIEVADQAERLHAAINGLPPDQRLTMIGDLRGRTDAEIAEKAGCSINRIASLRWDATCALRTALA